MLGHVIECSLIACTCSKNNCRFLSKAYNLHSQAFDKVYNTSLKISPSHGAGHAQVDSTNWIQRLLITVNEAMTLGGEDWVEDTGEDLERGSHE